MNSSKLAPSSGPVKTENCQSMQPNQRQIEIDALLTEIERLEKTLDVAMKNDLELRETKRLLHEVRLLREQYRDLITQINSSAKTNNLPSQLGDQR